ncbi:crotonobetaine/carnitine-CoA ligase [Jatrophihabitans sp. GAS493]|uniref:AMP-binding protein n=1 Tax=Jatrophihabitans sp. GAS493 TaxID=1907575 RepID=UPI000BB8843D|nr:AMP-binding protein [Jatrophihabitans sp. GAS493]SOD72108.1 crotonobetaine/carnitine-CoA ligase [Jatrophihabitans sp. GAS493]
MLQGNTVDAVLRERLAADPDSPFVSFGSDWFSLRDLDERSDRLATGLARLGVRRGDHVASILPNRVETIDLLFAVAKLGAVQVPLNYWIKGDFLEYQLVDSGAKFLIADGPGYEAAAGLLNLTDVQQVVHVGRAVPNTVPYADLLTERGTFTSEARPSDLLAIMYTSGTTAAAKGCMLSTGYYVTVGRAYGARNWVVPGDRMYTAHPLFHSSGQMVSFMSVLVNDASICFAPEFHASTYIADAVAAEATMLEGVGVMGNMILAQPPQPVDGAHPFRLAVWVPMSVENQAEFERRFNTPVISEGYGQTECVPITNSDPYGVRDRTTSGQVSPMLDVSVVDEHDEPVPHGVAGELVVRPRVPQAMFSGYWKKPDVTADAWRNLWHHTGDFGFVDAQGVITFVDRKKDMVRRRGENVSALALEQVIRQHPAIDDVAVCGVPAAVGDDDIKATLVLAGGATLTAPEFFAFVRDELPYFAIPRYVDIRGALPVNALGRVMKHVLRDEGVTTATWDLESEGLVLTRQERHAAQTTT